tara:strand:+ start:2279 stop:3001 length:723 start_codon:yes stop_codon:yes gene_type:complete
MKGLKLLRLVISEAIITGRKLDRYTTTIKRHVMKAIKDPEVREHFMEIGNVSFMLQDVPELDDIEYLRYVIIDISEGTPSASAAYEFDIDATEKQRKNSDIRVFLRLPRDFKDSMLGFIDEELTDALRHELEHSGQETSELMDCSKHLSGEEDIWASLSNAASYYMCPGEIAGHIAGFMKRAKRNRLPLGKIIDEELTFIYERGLREGYDEEELHSLMSMIRKEYLSYATKRYPKAQGIK